MKNKGKYLLYICNIVLTGLIIFNIFSYDIKRNAVIIASIDSQDNKYISYLEIDNTKKELLEESVVEDTPEEVKQEVKEEIKEEKKNSQPVVKEEIKVEQPIEEKKEEVEVNEPKEEKKQQEVVQEEVKKEETVLETLVGNLVGYGPDCAGCTSMKTASGKYIGEGNIYFDDATYGKVRIVAGDSSYPFGTIVRISNVDFYNDEPFYAVVLDRGGNIGKNRKFLFDLLFASEREAYKLGREENIKFEIVRLGY